MNNYPDSSNIAPIEKLNIRRFDTFYTKRSNFKLGRTYIIQTVHKTNLYIRKNKKNLR